MIVVDYEAGTTVVGALLGSYYDAVANSPEILSIRRMLRNKNVIYQNTKIIV
jgi:hypothetical protein